jgi:hypothetical protein
VSFLLSYFRQRPFALGVILVLLVNMPLLTTKRTVKWDAYDEMWTYFRFMGSSLRAGFFPDFFPGIVSGYPIGSNIQAGIYNIFYLAISALFADSVLSVNVAYVLFQLVIFSISWSIAASYSLCQASRLYFGLAMLASGFVVGHASHFSYLSTLVGFLGCVLGLRWAVQSRTAPSCSIILVSVYQMLSAGYPANILFYAQCLTLYWIYLICVSPGKRQSLLWIVCPVLAGVVLSTPSIWHFVHQLQRSPRLDGVDISAVGAGSMPLYSLFNMVFPAWKPRLADPTMERFHLLFITVPLMLYAVWRATIDREDRRVIVPLLVLAVLATILALGSNFFIPIRIWLAEHVFIYRTGRFPSGEHRGIALILIGLVSAIGLNRLLMDYPHRSVAVMRFIALDFVLIMFATQNMVRVGGIVERDQGFVPLIKVEYDADSQWLLDRPRDCSENSKNWSAPVLAFQKERLAPSGFSWDGYVGLRDADYERFKSADADLICGASRLWSAVTRQAQPYQLVTYTPGYISFRVLGVSSGTAQRLVWAEYDDGFWTLSINGEPIQIEHTRARLREFQARAGDLIEMKYQGPLSSLWR